MPRETKSSGRESSEFNSIDIKPVSKSYKRIIVNLIIVVVIVNLIALPFILFSIHRKIGERNAVNAVEYLYSFPNYEIVGQNTKKLEGITTSSVYNQLTIKNMNVALNTYLKFKGNPSQVQIIKVTPDYITYRLDTKSLSINRKFMFAYNTNLFGKINYVKQEELYDFFNNN